MPLHRNNTLGYNATTAWIKLGGRRIDSAVDYVSQKGVGQGAWQNVHTTQRRGHPASR